MNAMVHVNTTMTDVRIAVAIFGSTPETPIFARMAVTAANVADRRDQCSQFILKYLPSDGPGTRKV